MKKYVLHWYSYSNVNDKEHYVIMTDDDGRIYDGGKDEDCF